MFDQIRFSKLYEFFYVLNYLNLWKIFIGEAYLLHDEDEGATDEAINYLT